MANIASVVTVGPFTTFLGATISLINAAMRVRIPTPQPLHVVEVPGGGGQTEVAVPF